MQALADIVRLLSLCSYSPSASANRRIGGGNLSMSSSRTASVVKMTNARFEEPTVKPGTMGANTPCNFKGLYVNEQAVGHATQVLYKKNLPPQTREKVGSPGIDDESYRSRS